MNWGIFDSTGKLSTNLIILLSDDTLGGYSIYKIFKRTCGLSFSTWEYPYHLKQMQSYFKIIDRRI